MNAGHDWQDARGARWRAGLAGMESMLRPVDEPLLRALRLTGPARIAEVGCGGGGTAIEVLRRAPAGSVVHGLDISPELIDLARTRARPDVDALAFAVADMATAAPERPYDRLVSRFGVMFFADPPAAFANLSRWLTPGGRFAFAVWGPLANNVWMTAVRDAVAPILDVPPTDPDAPGPFRHEDPDKLLALLDGAGLSDLAVSPWRGALPIGGGLPPAEAATFALSSFSCFGEHLTRAGAHAFAEAHKSLTTRFSGNAQDGVVRMDAHVHIVTGTR